MSFGFLRRQGVQTAAAIGGSARRWPCYGNGQLSTDVWAADVSPGDQALVAGQELERAEIVSRHAFRQQGFCGDRAVLERLVMPGDDARASGDRRRRDLRTCSISAAPPASSCPSWRLSASSRARSASIGGRPDPALRGLRTGVIGSCAATRWRPTAVTGRARFHPVGMRRTGPLKPILRTAVSQRRSPRHSLRRPANRTGSQHDCFRRDAAFDLDC